MGRFSKVGRGALFLVGLTGLWGCPTPEPEPSACGVFSGSSCEPGQFCSYAEDALCGAADATGLCEAIPSACTEEYAPVCGCDGKTYGNECTANAAGVSVAKRGECEKPAVSCDRRNLLCKRAETPCPEGQVHEIVGNCYGECVAIEQCACDEADACPNNDAYTCHLYKHRCGPYVN